MKRWMLALLAAGFLLWNVTPALDVAPALAYCHGVVPTPQRCTTTCTPASQFSPQRCETTCYGG